MILNKTLFKATITFILIHGELEKKRCSYARKKKKKNLWLSQTSYNDIAAKKLEPKWWTSK